RRTGCGHEHTQPRDHPERVRGAGGLDVAMGAAGRLSCRVVGSRWPAPASAVRGTVLRRQVRRTVQARRRGRRTPQGGKDDPTPGGTERPRAQGRDQGAGREAGVAALMTIDPQALLDYTTVRNWLDGLREHWG